MLFSPPGSFPRVGAERQRGLEVPFLDLNLGQKAQEVRAVTCNVLGLQKSQTSLHEHNTIFDFIRRCHGPTFVKAHYVLVSIYAVLWTSEWRGFSYALRQRPHW
jgi:hypothetical protein